MAAVRHARESDTRLLTVIGLRAWEKAIAGLADVEKMRPVAEHAFHSFLAAHWTAVLTIEQEGRICGWAAREGFDGTITDLWIDPDLQGKGLGSALLVEMERRIVEDGFDDANLQTHAQNDAAIGFFRKHDYAVNWLSTAYSPKLDRDIQSVGLIKRFGGAPGDSPFL